MPLSAPSKMAWRFRLARRSKKGGLAAHSSPVHLRCGACGRAMASLCGPSGSPFLLAPLLACLDVAELARLAGISAAWRVGARSEEAFAHGPLRLRPEMPSSEGVVLGSGRAVREARPLHGDSPPYISPTYTH